MKKVMLSTNIPVICRLNFLFLALSSDALMRAYRRRVDDVNAKVEELKLKQPGKHTIQSVLSGMSNYDNLFFFLKRSLVNLVA
jgi:hypothetical protein